MSVKHENCGFFSLGGGTKCIADIAESLPNNTIYFNKLTKEISLKSVEDDTTVITHFPAERASNFSVSRFIEGKEHGSNILATYGYKLRAESVVEADSYNVYTIYSSDDRSNLNFVQFEGSSYDSSEILYKWTETHPIHIITIGSPSCYFPMPVLEMLDAGTGENGEIIVKVKVSKDFPLSILQKFSSGEIAYENDSTNYSYLQFVEAPYNGDMYVGKQTAAFGNDLIASASSAFSQGTGSIAAGKYSCAFNSNTYAGYMGFATGSGSRAYGNTSFVAGTNTVTGLNASNAAAFGRNNEANGYAAATFGQDNRSNGNYAFSANYANKADGESSAVFGIGNIALNKSQFVCGKFSLDSKKGTELFIVGNGDSDTARKNVFEINSNIQMVLGENSSSGNRTFSGGNSANGSGFTNSIIFGKDINKSTKDASGNTINRSGDSVLIVGNNNDAQCAFSESIMAGTANIVTADPINTSVIGAAVFGRYNSLGHRYSSVFGMGHTTTCQYQTLVGKYSNPSNKDLFAVGNGTDTAKTNVLSIDSDGLIIAGKGNKVITGAQGVAESIVAGLNNTITSADRTDNKSITSSAVFGRDHVVGHRNVLVAGEGAKTTRDYQVLFGCKPVADADTLFAIGCGDGTNIVTMHRYGSQNETVLSSDLSMTHHDVEITEGKLEIESKKLEGVDSSNFALRLNSTIIEGSVLQGTQTPVYGNILNVCKLSGFSTNKSTHNILSGYNFNLDNASAGLSYNAILGKDHTIKAPTYKFDESLVAGLNNTIDTSERTDSLTSSMMFGRANTLKHRYALIGGIGNTSTRDGQTLLGNYTSPTVSTIIAVGDGNDSTHQNAFEVTSAKKAFVYSKELSTKEYVDGINNQLTTSISSARNEAKEYTDTELAESMASIPMYWGESLPETLPDAYIQVGSKTNSTYNPADLFRIVIGGSNTLAINAQKDIWAAGSLRAHSNLELGDGTNRAVLTQDKLHSLLTIAEKLTSAQLTKLINLLDSICNSFEFLMNDNGVDNIGKLDYDPGMTWREFIDSEFNVKISAVGYTDAYFYIDGDKVMFGDGKPDSQQFTVRGASGLYAEGESEGDYMLGRPKDDIAINSPDELISHPVYYIMY